jgi:hypothetical protein
MPLEDRVAAVTAVKHLLETPEAQTQAVAVVVEHTARLIQHRPAVLVS